MLLLALQVLTHGPGAPGDVLTSVYNSAVSYKESHGMWNEDRHGEGRCHGDRHATAR